MSLDLESGFLLVRLLMYNLVAAAALVSVNRKDRISLAFVWDKFSGILPGLVCSVLFKIPVIYSESSVWPWRYAPPTSVLAKFRYRISILVARILARFCAAVHANSNSLREGMVENRIPLEKIAVIPNGVDVSEFLANRGLPESFTVGFVGRLVPERGAPLLLDVIRAALARIPNIRFLIVGDGPLRGSFQGLSTRQVAMVGQASRSDIPQHLGRMTAVLFLSPTENFPSVALLEALAAGRVVIATNVGNTPSVLTNGKNAILVPPSVEEIVMVVQHLSGDSSTVRRISKEATDLATQFDWKSVVGLHMALYSHLLESQLATS